MNGLFLPRCDDEWMGYRRIRDRANYSLCKASLEDLWQTYHPYADPNFREEIRKSPEDFHQRFWEMYLGCELLRQVIFEEEEFQQRARYLYRAWGE